MTLLAIDVGNTNTVLGLFEGDDLVRSWRIKTDARSTADEMALVFRGLLAGEPEVTGIALCSTVPAVLREMRHMLTTYHPETPTVIVEPGTKTGVPVLTDNPKEVGTDRIVNTMAAHHLYGGPSIVVDFGTSTNLDVVSVKGEFLGGALAPGIEISLDALAQRAAQLRKVELVRPRSPIGKNTVEALQSGALYGFAGQVDGLVRRISDELGGVQAVIAT
ncbi:MAG: type III pantothenate kinase, partial [Candidatus Nanopelagicales bacterium]